MTEPAPSSPAPCAPSCSTPLARPKPCTVREPADPAPEPGWVLIRVEAFGLNRSELHTRLGLAQGVTFPRVLGIEATGIVAACPGRRVRGRQQVVAMMGGMGRAFDGGYAEYTCVPAEPGDRLHAASWRGRRWARCPRCCRPRTGRSPSGSTPTPGQSLLVRGGTSSVGMATAVLAKLRGLTVLSTTRNPPRPTR